MRLISPFLSLLLTPLLVVSGVWAQMPGGSAVAARDAAQDLQIRIVPRDTPDTAAHSAAAADLLIQVMDANGAAVPGAAVVFRLPDSGITGTFSDGTRAAVAYTDQHGRAHIPPLQWSASSGIAPIRVSAVKGTAHAGILVEQNVSAATAPGVSIADVAPLPSPPPAPGDLPAIAKAVAPVQQPGAIAPVTAQIPTSEPKVTVTGASPQGETHSKTKWIVIAAIAIGAGVGVAMAMKGKSSSSTATTTGLSIGAPSSGGSVGPP